MMFPSRTKLEQPIAPSYVCKRFQVILERAGCKRVRFHDLRHIFNTDTHITDEMRWKVALNITQGIGKGDKGRHTTTGREMFPCPVGGVVIDTPGMREMGAESADLSQTFGEIEGLARRFAKEHNKKKQGKFPG